MIIVDTIPARFKLMITEISDYHHGFSDMIPLELGTQKKTYKWIRGSVTNISNVSINFLLSSPRGIFFFEKGITTVPKAEFFLMKPLLPKEQHMMLQAGFARYNLLAYSKCITALGKNILSFATNHPVGELGLIKSLISIEKATSDNQYHVMV